MKTLTNKKAKEKKKNPILFLAYLQFFSHFLNLFRSYNLFLNNREFFFQKSLILTREKCKLKLFSYCNLSQYYSMQNLFDFEIADKHSFVIIKENLKFDFNLKTIDIVLQKLFIKIISNSMFIKNSLRLKKFSQRSIFIFYKWYIIFNFNLSFSNSSEKISLTNFGDHNIRFQKSILIKFNLKKKLLDIKKINGDLIDSLAFTLLNSILGQQIFFKYISTKSDSFLVYTAEEFFKIYEIFKSRFFFFSKNFFSMLLNHISTRPILSFIKIYYFTPDSFILEKTTIFRLKNGSERILNIYFNKKLSSISRGCVIRCIKIFKLNRIFNSILLKKLEPSRNDVFEKFKKLYICLNHLNLIYFENYKKFLKFQSIKHIENLIWLIQKTNLIFFDENLNYTEFQMYQGLVILFLIFLKKNLLPELKILIISWNSKKIVVNSVGLCSNIPKKFFSICLSVLEFNLATHSLHDTIFGSNVTFFKKKFKNFLTPKRRNQFLNRENNCSIIKKLKKCFFQINTKTKWSSWNNELKTREREKIKNYRFVGSISNTHSFLEMKYFSNLRIKKFFTESIVSLSFFFKTHLISNFFNLIPTFFSPKKTKLNRNKKSSGLPIQFYSSKNKSKRLVFGICLFCFLKKKKKIQDFFKILFRNFLNLENIKLTFYSRFSICFQGFKSLVKKIGSFYLEVFRKIKDSFFFPSRKRNFLFFVKFLRNKKLFPRKLLKNLDFKKNIDFTSSFIQNFFFFSTNFFIVSFNQSTIRWICFINSLKNIISIKFSLIIYPIVEYFYHKNKKLSQETRFIFNHISILKNFLPYDLKNIEILSLRFNLEQKIIQLIKGEKMKKNEKIFLVICQTGIFINIVKKKKSIKFKKNNTETRIELNRDFFLSFYRKIFNVLPLNSILSNYMCLFHRIIFCKLLNCKIYIDFNLIQLFKTPNVFFKKLNSELFIITIEKNLNRSLRRKKLIGSRNLFFKIINYDSQVYVNLYKNNKFVKEIKKNGKVFIDILFFIPYILIFTKCLEIFFKFGQRLSFKISLKNRPYKFLTNLFLISFLRFCKTFKSKTNILDFFEYKKNFSSCYLFVLLKLYKYDSFMHKISYQKKDRFFKKNLFLLDKTLEKTQKIYGCFFSKKENSMFLSLKNFIFSNKKLSIKTLTNSLSFNIKNNPTSLKLKQIEYLILNQCAFSNSKLKLIVDFFIFRLKFNIIDIIKWVYFPTKLNWKIYLFSLKIFSECFHSVRKKDFKLEKNNKKVYNDLWVEKISSKLERLGKMKLLNFFSILFNYFCKRKHYILNMDLKKKIEEKLQKNMFLFFKTNNLENFLTPVNNGPVFSFRNNLFSIFNFKLRTSLIFQTFFKISRKGLKFHWNSYKLYENFSVYNIFLFDFFNSSHLLLINKIGVRKKIKKFFKPKKQFIFLFKLFNMVHFMKIKFLNKLVYSEKFKSDTSFILHLFLKASKHKHVFHNHFKLFPIYRNLLRPGEISISKTSNFSLKPENSLIFCFQKIQLFKIILSYKKLVSKIFLEKNVSVKKIEKLLKKFLILVSRLKFSVLFEFDFKLKAFKIYLLSLLNSKNIEFQQFSIYFIKKLIDLNFCFFFEWYTFLKLTFLEIFIFDNKKTNNSYPIILKLFQKSLIPSNYLNDILKILMNFLNVNETLLRIKTQIYLCFLFLLITSKNISIVLKKIFREILGYRLHIKFIFRIPLLFLLFSLSFLQLNLNVFIHRLGEFSNFFPGNKLWKKKSYFSKFFTLFFKKIENNRVSLLFKKKCRVCYNMSILDFKMALKFKNFFQAKKNSSWFPSTKFLIEEIGIKIKFTLNNNLTIGSLILYKNILSTIVELSTGNISIVNLPSTFFKFFLLNFFSKKETFLKKKKYKIRSDFLCYLISFPSLIKFRCSAYFRCLFKKKNSLEFFYKTKTIIFSTDCFFLIMNLFKVIRVGFLKKNTIQRFSHYLLKTNKKFLFFFYNGIQYNLLQCQVQLFFTRELLNKLSYV